MKFFLPFLLIAAPLVTAQTIVPGASIGKIESWDDGLSEVLEVTTPIEIIASGLTWSEGPVWVKDAEAKGGGYLLFSDVPQNTVFRWEQGKDGLSAYLKPSGYTGPDAYSNESGSNGLCLDKKGRLLSCEHGDRRVSVLTKSGKMTLADRFEGKRFNSPNDLCVKSDGSVYFTDPPYGLPGGPESELRESDIFGVYRIKEGKIDLVTGALNRPNGIALSPDEKTLYVAQSDPKAAVIMAYPIQEDGLVGEGKVLLDVTDRLKDGPGLPDGLKVDVKGNLWVTGPAGVWIVSPEGKALGRITTGVSTANCAWGNDGSVLYITADMWILRVTTKTKGAGW